MIANQISLLLAILLSLTATGDSRKIKDRSNSKNTVKNTDGLPYHFDENLVGEQCAREYSTLSEGALREVVTAETTTHVRPATNGFTQRANRLDVPGFDTYDRTSVYGSGRRYKRAGNQYEEPEPPSVTYTLNTIQPRTEGPEQTLGKALFYYRVNRRDSTSKGTLTICELETFYVRRFNKFPFFVKSVSCRKNRAIMAEMGSIVCHDRKEWGHILRLEDEKECKAGDQTNWVHEWESRVVGCDAMWNSKKEGH